MNYIRTECPNCGTNVVSLSIPLEYGSTYRCEWCKREFTIYENGKCKILSIEGKNQPMETATLIRNKPLEFTETTEWKKHDNIVTGVKGGKQSKITTAFSLMPHRALLEVGHVMAQGAERYEKDNWRKLTPDEIYDHLMEHLINWHLTGDKEELAHGMARAMMLWEVAEDAAE